MKQVLFVKYTRTRKTEYQISTTIYQENGVKLVQKKALTKEAIPHIQNLYTNYEALQKAYQNVTVLKPEVKGNTADYPFLEGQTVEESLLPYLYRKEALLEKIKEVNQRLFSYNKEVCTEFVYENAFREVFGEVAITDKEAVTVANIDSMYDNFMEKDGVVTCIDCEWVINAPVPIAYLVYRSLSSFYRKYNMYLKKTISEEEYYAYFDITPEKRECYEELENAFQEYVHGEKRKYIYTQNYQKAVVKIDNLDGETFALQSFRQLENKDRDITRLNELCHVKDAIINDKDTYIADLEAIIAKMRKNPLYLAGRIPFKLIKIIKGSKR